MKLRLVAKTERSNTYCLRFIVPQDEQRYRLTPVSGSNDHSIEFTFKKDGVFGESTPESARADNAAWFAALLIDDDWDLKKP